MENNGDFVYEIENDDLASQGSSWRKYSDGNGNPFYYDEVTLLFSITTEVKSFVYMLFFALFYM